MQLNSSYIYLLQGTIKLLCQIGQDRAIAEQHVKIVSKQMEKIKSLQKVRQNRQGFLFLFFLIIEVYLPAWHENYSLCAGQC